MLYKQCKLMHRYGHTKEIWEILKSLLPEFKLPDPPPDEDELAKREVYNVFKN